MNNRILTQTAISFLLGILGSRYGNPGKYGVFTGGILWIGILAVWLFWLGRMAVRQRKGCMDAILRLGICIIAGVAGFLQFQTRQHTVFTVEQYLSDRKEITVAGKIDKKEEKNQKTIYYLKKSCIISKTDCISCNQIMITLDADDYSIGDTITVKGKPEIFETACNEGNFDEKDYYCSRGILFRVKADSVVLKTRQKLLWQEALYQLRKRICNVYRQKLPEKEAGVLAVMTMGEKGMLDPEVKKLYQQSGISHVLAISGLHISILGMNLYQLLRKRGASYVCAGLLSGSVILLFGRLSGMELSTARAVTMFVILLLGNILGMAYDSVTALSLSAILQMWQNPYCLWNTGFLFSYGAVLAVVTAAKVLRQYQKSSRRSRWKTALVDTVFTSSCIQLATLPLTVYFYYEFPVYSIGINSLLLPFMGYLLVSGVAGGLTGLFAGLGGWTGFLSERLSWLLLQPAYGLLRWNEKLCSLCAKLPGAVWITGKPPFIMMAVYYLILAMVLGILYRRRENPGRMGRAVCLAALLLNLFVLLQLRPRQQLTVCFLDVGQGDGIYLQTESGACYFVDGGSTSEKKVGEYRILSFLKCRGADHVDGWFVSHADQDHISGLLEVWESGYRIRRLFLSSYMVKDEAWQELCAMAEAHGTEILYLKPSDQVEAGNTKIVCLFPGEEALDRNSSSMVLRLLSPGMTALFAGDISGEEEKRLVNSNFTLKADLYKAAHHGSDSSNSEAFLEELQPAVTVVSCSADNSYGHPGKEAVERIQNSGSRIFYTMLSGQVTVMQDGQGIRVTGWKEK